MKINPRSEDELEIRALASSPVQFQDAGIYRTALSKALALVDAERKTITALRKRREQMWCRSCGTVTRDDTCDCTMGAEPGEDTGQRLVNYADAMQEEAIWLQKQLFALKARTP